MKYNFIIIVFSLCIPTICIQGQVGINTTNPQQGALHIDPLGNNPASGTPAVAQYKDDVLINSNGNVGLGTITPAYRLDLQSSTVPRSMIKIEDGSHGPMKTLQTDANGNSKWTYDGMEMVMGQLTQNGITIKASDLQTMNASFIFTGATITLPPGQWCVMVNMLIYSTGGSANVYGEKTWLRTTFSDPAPAALGFSTDILPGTSKLASGSLYTVPYSAVQGYIILYNRTTKSKVYRYTMTYINPGLPIATQVNNFACNANSPIWTTLKVPFQNSIIAVRM